jgi:hypothetical protein
MITAKDYVKKVLRPFLPETVLNSLRQQRTKKEIEDWENSGCPSPPPHIIKQNIIGEYQQRSGYSTLIETGTYMGEMVEAQKSRFKKIFSIELGHDLFKNACERFYKDEHVSIVLGDSGKVLSSILKLMTEPVIFWLDGHYSSGITAKGETECPIIEELDAIFNSSRLNHILLIDDARCFNGQGDYPTLEKLSKYIREGNGQYQIEVKHDIIRCVI